LVTGEGAMYHTDKKSATSIQKVIDLEKENERLYEKLDNLKTDRDKIMERRRRRK